MPSINTSMTNSLKNINKEYLAIFLMIIGTTLLTLGFIYSNEHKLHPATTAFTRGVTIVIITYLLARNKDIDLSFKSTHNFKWQMIRNFTMLIHSLVYAWSQFYLPLPIAITLNSTSAIFTAVLDKIINNVSINRKQSLWMAVAFIGVALTANANYILYAITG